MNYIEIYKLASSLLKVAKNKTLYHGTSKDKANSIISNGLIPQVGYWTSKGYKLDDGHNFPNLTFSADKQEMYKVIGGIENSVANYLGKHVKELTDKDIKDNGAIVVMYEAYDPHGNETEDYKWKRTRPMEERYNEYLDKEIPIKDFKRSYIYDEDPELYEEKYPQVEPGDYFSEQNIKVDRILTGEPMIRLLRSCGEWPRFRGPELNKHKRQFEIKEEVEYYKQFPEENEEE